MKKIYLLIVLAIMLIPNILFAAGTANISGPSTVENGSNVTISVTLRNTAAWNIRMSGNGSTSGCSKTEADVTSNGNNTTKTFTLTCKATSLGTINFSVSGDITSSDGTNSNVSLSKQVTVVAPREKETEARLNSLSVDGYDIGFDKDKTNYNIEIEPTVNSVTINASTISRYASVNGTGVKNIESDDNTFIITSVAENGSKIDYTINVTVKDSNPITANIDGKDYTVYKSNKSIIIPTNYIETTITINDIQVPAFTNETTKLTVIRVKDAEGNIKYATYSNGNYSLYNENKSNDLLLYITDKKINGHKKINLNINDNTYTAYEINDRFSIVYAMNINTGEYNYYKYDNKDNTFQYYEIEKNNLNIFMITTIILSLILLLLVCYIILSILKNRKMNKNQNVIEYEERKIQNENKEIISKKSKKSKNKN